MAVLALPDGKLFYEWVTAANGERTDRPILVFVHGWGGSARYWKATATALSNSYDCLLYDMKGFGRSTIQTNAVSSLASCTADLASLLKHLAIERLSIMSHSMGSSIATLFLGQYGAQVDQAILTCGGIFEYDARAFQIFYKFGSGVVKFRPQWLTQVPGMDWLVMQRFLHRGLPKGDRQEFLEDFLMAADNAALETMFDAVSEETSVALPQVYAELAMPTLMISGEYDRIIPVKLGQAAAALNPDIEFTVQRNVGHFPMLEDAPVFLDRVRSFLTAA
ncbi:alpha/beta hydrolase [filamentous cyanobacterium LEGE 11480]|uniref:Alpha/beta hydrolase n=1 Tax=Romeriopsis navalis LEGE 11480 TaxID=2777977 RepID=A0A928Z3K2_9CYAN|nr:alpha/beta hydrolase [Romeriopsis navalis]MBE9030769.1 alpha/beta hydrolase [Romeriopsis navalis LEGE 11480]